MEVLVEQNINGKMDTSYVYGVDRLSLDRFDGSTGYYLYDPRGSVAGIANEEGQLYQSYRYGVTGEVTFGTPQYENEYTYNGESYNPNIESQYLRARYYNVVTAAFLTEDSYLGDINEPLTLNRYNYCVSSYLNYQDPSGNWVYEEEIRQLRSGYRNMYKNEKRVKSTPSLNKLQTFLSALHELGVPYASVDFVLHFDYSSYQNRLYIKNVEKLAEKKNENYACEVFSVTLQQLKDFGWKQFEGNENKFIVNFNRILNKYDISDDASITMFMATMAHESNYGIDNIEGMRNGKETLTEDNWDAYINKVSPNSGMEFNERGAGYIQLSWDKSQDLFLNDMGAYGKMQSSGMDRVHFIAENYSLEAAAWFWATPKVKATGAGSLNDYAEKYGNSEGIYLITQYFINGFTASQSALEVVRNGGDYEITKDKLIVGDSSYPLPKNWEDRREKYEKAYAIFGK